MNLIDLVEQAHAVVRVWDGDWLVDVVPVRYPEMLTFSSELAYTGRATRHSDWSLSVPPPIIPSRPPSTPQSTCRNDSIRQKGGLSAWPG